MFKRTMLILAVAGMALSARAGRLVGSDVDATAKWVAHADMDQLRGTEVGRFLLNKLQAPKAQDKFAAFKAMFRFDPRTDLKGVTLYGWGKGDNDGVLIVRGVFEPEHLVALLRANDDYGVSTYRGHEVHTWVDDKKRAKAEADGTPAPRSYGSFYTSGMAVMGDRLEQLERALDVLDRREPSLDQAEPFAGLEEIQSSSFLLASAHTGKMENVNPRAAVLRNTQSLLLGVGESAGEVFGTMVMGTESPEAATSVKMITDGILGLMLLNAEKEPAAARLALATQVAIDGSNIMVTMAYPVDEVIAFIEEQEAKKKNASP